MRAHHHAVRIRPTRAPTPTRLYALSPIRLARRFSLLPSQIAVESVPSDINEDRTCT